MAGDNKGSLPVNQRGLAVEALMHITHNKGYNNLVLQKTLNAHPALGQKEKAFITELVNGALRHILLLDNVIGHYSKTPVKKIKPFILNVLRLGIYQLLFMDKVPPSAACNESVKLAKSKGFVGLAPYVNGVLRQVAANGKNLPLPDRSQNVLDYLSLRYSTPRWLLEYWQPIMAMDVMETMLAASVTSPPVTICVNTLKTTPESLTETLTASGVEVRPCPGMPQALQLTRTAQITALPAFQDGLFHVMDAGAMAAVQVLNPQPGQTVLDLCAAPGGKSFLSAQLMANEGHILSMDIHPHRLPLITDTANRLGLTCITTQQGDATVFNPALENTADCLLIDVPCSGFGLLRKKPDIKYTKTMEDVEALARIQRDILAASHRYVKKGGTLVYCTCTISTKENEENYQAFLEAYDFEPVPLVEAWPSVLQLSQVDSTQSMMQLLPGAYAGDGFFIALCRRK